MPPVLSTWFYAEREGEESVYPQVGGRSSSTWFQAVYWRCVAGFFATSARVNPGAEHRLYTNVDAVPDVNGVDTRALLGRLGVEVVVLPYASRPPAGWFPAWANQFYVLDVAAHLAETLPADDAVGVLLDSDCVITRPVGPLVEAARRHGALSLDVGIGPDEDIHGLTPRELGRLFADLGGAGGDGQAAPATYSGGELLAATRGTLRAITAEARAVWPELRRRHAEGLPKFNEEAHLLSYAYHRLGLEAGTADAFAARMFTWFGDEPLPERAADLMIWHLPNEKRLGFRRLFRAVRDERSWFWTLPPGDAWRARLGHTLGVPRRTPTKWVKDLGRAVRDKVERPG